MENAPRFVRKATVQRVLEGPLLLTLQRGPRELFITRELEGDEIGGMFECLQEGWHAHGTGAQGTSQGHAWPGR